MFSWNLPVPSESVSYSCPRFLKAVLWLCSLSLSLSPQGGNAVTEPAPYPHKSKLSCRGSGSSHPLCLEWIRPSGMGRSPARCHHGQCRLKRGTRGAGMGDGSSTHSRVCSGKKRGPRLSLREEGRNPLRLQEGLSVRGKEGISYCGALTLYLQLPGNGCSLEM